MPEGTSLGKYYVQIVPTTEGISSSISKELEGVGSSAGETAGSGFSSSFTGALGTAAKVGAAAIATVGTAAAAAGGALVSAAGDVAAYGDEIDKNSQKMGLSAGAYQEWDYVLGQAGTSMANMGTGLKTLTNKIDDAKNGSEDAQDMFKQLGISMDDLNSMSREDIFAATITGFQGMADSTERAALANDLFGKSGQELTPLFNQSAEATQELIKNANELGFVMSDEMVSASADYKDALDTLTRTMGGLKTSMVSELLPGITGVMDGLTAIFSGDQEGGIAQISQGIDDLISGLSERLPEFLDIGIGILDGILTAIEENLPKLMEAGADIIMKLVDALLDHLPEIVKTGLEVIVSLATGIAENLPELIPAIVDVILEIVDILTQPDSIVMLVDAALQIILALAKGLVEAIPRLIEAVPTIISNLVQAIVKLTPELLKAGVELIKTLASGMIKNTATLVATVPKLFTAFFNGMKAQYNSLLTMGRNVIVQVKNGIFQRIQEARTWGRDLLQNFINGIKDKITALVNQLKNVGTTVKNYLGFSEPELGPLSNFHTFAPDMMKLWAQGIYDNTGLVADAVQYAAGTASANMALGSGVRGSNSTVQVGRTTPTSTKAVQAGRNLTVILELDRTQLGRAVYRMNNEETQRVGLRLAGGYA